MRCRSPTREPRPKGRAGSPEPSQGVFGRLLEGSVRKTRGRAGSSFYSTSSAFCAASCACSHAAGSVSVTPRATTSRPSLMTSQYQRPSLPLGIMRNSTFSISSVLRPEMIMRGKEHSYRAAGELEDSLYRAAFRAHEGAEPRLAAPRRNIGHLIHPPAALLAGRVWTTRPFWPLSQSH